mgnify:CR=1 FL=1
MLCSDTAQGGFCGESSESYIYPPDRVRVCGVPDAELLESGNAELFELVPRGIQGGTGEVWIEGIKVLEVYGERFQTLYSHLREGLLVLYLAPLVPEALYETGEGLLRLDQIRHGVRRIKIRM